MWLNIIFRVFLILICIEEIKDIKREDDEFIDMLIREEK